MSGALLDRVAWPTGSRLAADDLRDWLGYESRLWALHRAGLHRSWGIVHGLTVLPAPDGRSVRVAAGVGLLPTGDPLVVAGARDERPAPDALRGSRVFDLLLRPGAERIECCCPEPPRCEAERVPEPRARLEWLPVPAPAGCAPPPDEALTLARVAWRANGTVERIDGTERPATRRWEQPPVATDRTGIAAELWALDAGVFRGTIDFPPGRFPTPPSVVLQLVHPAGPPVFATLLATPGVVTSARFVCEARFAHAPGAAAAVLAQGRAWLGQARCHWLAVDVRRCGVSLLPISPFFSPGGYR
jgi:hypothetical protein